MVKNDKAHKLILDIVEKIKEEYSPQAIILFGSYAYGEPEKESDIDLLIIKDTNEKVIDRIIQIYKIGNFRKIDLSPFVISPEELKRRIEMGDHFFKEILSRGEVLYEKQRIRPS